MAEVAYAERLKALHADSELFSRLKDFVHDLVAFKNNKRARLHLLQEPTAEFYMSSAYFSPDEDQALLSFKRGDGLTLEEALQAVVARKLKHARDGTASSYELCTSYDLTPVLQDHFTMSKAGNDTLKNKKN